MKKLLLSLSCLCSIAASGQDGFFLQPIAGPGATNVNHTDYNDHMTSGHYALAFDFGILAGYQAGHWRFNTGLMYLRTGTTVPITLTDAMGNPIGTSNIHYRYSHVVLPVMAGHTLRMAKKLSFTPSAGVGISYNIATSEKDDFIGQIRKMPASQFKHDYHQFSCFGLLQAELDYHISSNVSISCAPAFDYMLTNMYRAEANPFFAPKEYHYALMLNLGVKWLLAKKEKQPVK